MAGIPPGTEENIDLIDFTDACMEAARRYNLNGPYLVALAGIESGIRNIGAHGGSTTAFGPFQILDTTWSDYMNRDNNGFSANDRFDPLNQPIVAAQIADDGARTLLKVLGRNPTPAELYFPHFFGVGGAKIILGQDKTMSIKDALDRVYPGKPATVSKVLSGNQSLLVSGNTPRTIEGVLAEVNRRLQGAFEKALPANILSLVDPDLRRELVASTEKDGVKFWIVNEFDEDGGQLLIKQEPGKASEVVKADQTVFPVAASDKVPQDVADILNRAKPEPQPDNPPELGVAAGEAGDRNSKLFAGAKAAAAKPLSSFDAPGTNHGKVACAWAVNTIAKQVLGAPLGGGLSTAQMAVELKKNNQAVPENAIQAGDVVISPTAGGNVGHVGVVGESAGGNTLIYSNSSAAAQFKQNFTVTSWNTRYKTKKGLPVLFFRP